MPYIIANIGGKLYRVKVTKKRTVRRTVKRTVRRTRKVTRVSKLRDKVKVGVRSTVSLAAQIRDLKTFVKNKFNIPIGKAYYHRHWGDFHRLMKARKPYLAKIQAMKRQLHKGYDKNRTKKHSYHIARYDSKHGAGAYKAMRIAKHEKHQREYNERKAAQGYHRDVAGNWVKEKAEWPDVR